MGDGEPPRLGPTHAGAGPVRHAVCSNDILRAPRFSQVCKRQRCWDVALLHSPPYRCVRDAVVRPREVHLIEAPSHFPFAPSLQHEAGRYQLDTSAPRREIQVRFVALDIVLAHLLDKR